ncbi:MAG: hypothetical protein HY255_11970 [Betaproteobacteria bacterium]|nr:hypothetical protein [Betaproteobacteria bacterium]
MIGTDTISRSQTLDRDGFSIVSDVVAAVEIEEIAASFGTVSTIGAGTRRLLDFAWCRDLVDTIGRHPGISALLPIAYKAIQCTYFCKSADKNWLVAMHQDLAIPAKDRVSHSQLGNWSVKENQWFAQAPVALLDSLLTVRLHLDDSQE